MGEPSSCSSICLAASECSFIKRIQWRKPSHKETQEPLSFFLIKNSFTLVGKSIPRWPRVNPKAVAASKPKSRQHFQLFLVSSWGESSDSFVKLYDYSNMANGCSDVLVGSSFPFSRSPFLLTVCCFACLKKYT